jgi:hypothetical protein
MENEFRLNKKSTSFTTDAFNMSEKILFFFPLQELLCLAVAACAAFIAAREILLEQQLCCLGEQFVFVRNKFRNVQFVPHHKWSNVSFNKIGRFFGKAFTLSLRVFKRKHHLQEHL